MSIVMKTMGMFGAHNLHFAAGRHVGFGGGFGLGANINSQ